MIYPERLRYTQIHPEMKTTQGFGDPDFYNGYLRKHLSEHHFEKENTPKFIESRVDDALDTYTEAFAAGRPPYICQEMAMRTLLKGIYVSRYDIIYNILEEDCWRRLSSETWEVTAIHFTHDSEINAILDRHGVNGDFLDRGDYQAMRLEILGTLTERLDGYDL